MALPPSLLYLIALLRRLYTNSSIIILLAVILHGVPSNFKLTPWSLALNLSISTQFFAMSYIFTVSIATLLSDESSSDNSMMSFISVRSLWELLCISPANLIVSSCVAIPFSINSEYPEMDVRGVFNSCDTFAVNSCRTWEFFTISSCCFFIVSIKGCISLYVFISFISSILLASSSTGFTILFVI